MLGALENIIRSVLPDVRDREYEEALKFLGDCHSLLDVGCGTGTFLHRCVGREALGVDINPDNVAYCRGKGLDAVEGDALALDFPNDSFDGVHCSHVLQVFESADGVRMIKELGRVVKPGGTIVLTTLNQFKHFFQHPENARPYPPSAIRALFGRRSGATSPMYPDLPNLEIDEIWLRKMPLIKFRSEVSHTCARLSSVLNAFQYKLLL